MKDSFIIENSLIKRELFIKSDKISGFSFVNKCSGKQITALEKSEEFEIVFKYCFRTERVKASELKISDKTVTDENGTKIYCITFRAFSIRDSRIKIKLVYSLGEYRSYIRKHLELSFERKGEKDIRLDSIAFEKLVFPQDKKFWTIPAQKNSVIPGKALSMGQPVYVDSLYMGYEFPVCLSKIEKNCATVVYYSGKTLKTLIESGSYITYKSVVGAADSDVFEDVRKSFFDYIKDISKPVYLRRQYNSWYDNMLNITKENVSSSFLEIEKAMTATGEPPLASYVADDGWNDYSKDFWSFNEKFPDELYPFKNLAKALGSRFGLWLGPRGGYTNDTIKFARKIQSAGNGYVNKQAMDICVGSEKYTKLTTDLLLDFQKRFDLNYYKLDGFAQYPCKNKHHDHMVGGYNDMYFYSDIWERWIETFEKMQHQGKEDFWINLTCYAWPSPWFLQWVNSVWIQTSLDVGFAGKKEQVSDKDRMLSYRDGCYYDFYRNRQFQFPQRALYNHDPIYGKEAKVSLTDDEFREYLFTMATRGTQFWELYYSHSLMNEAKWRINYACLRFIEENMDILANSVIFGGKPTESQVYGYSCFGEHEGIVSVRNSDKCEQTFTFRLDELIGVKKSFAFGEAYTVLPYTCEAKSGAYSYGDTVTVTLAPYQTKILHFGKKKKDVKINYVRALSERKLMVQFNQTVDISSVYCNDNSITKTELLEDYMTVVFEFGSAFGEDNKLLLGNIKDIMGNAADVEAEFCYYENNIVSGGIKGSYDFSVEINITDKNVKTLYKQGDEVEITVGEDRFVRFKVGVCTLKSSVPVTEAVQITAVRERNNVLKLYINKSLDSGMKSVSTELRGDAPEKISGINVKVYNRALSYSEV